MNKWVTIRLSPQSQMVHLDKALKSAAEQKEQLQHKALKINSELVDMVRENATTRRNSNTR